MTSKTGLEPDTEDQRAKNQLAACVDVSTCKI